jgi:hypothetical protein
MVVQQIGRRMTPQNHKDLLDVWQEQVDRARRGQASSWSLAQDLAKESAEAYDEFLESIYFYYGENTRAAEEDTKEG